MEQSTNQAPQNEQQLQVWVREQFQKANKHLASKGIIPNAVVAEQSRYFAPHVAVWKLKTADKKAFWVISGDVPADHVEISAAETARDALRVFSFRWQMQAEQIVRDGVTEKTQVDFANLLVNRAHGIYDLFANEQIWQASHTA